MAGGCEIRDECVREPHQRPQHRPEGRYLVAWAASSWKPLEACAPFQDCASMEDIYDKVAWFERSHSNLRHLRLHRRNIATFEYIVYTFACQLWKHPLKQTAV